MKAASIGSGSGFERALERRMHDSGDPSDRLRYPRAAGALVLTPHIAEEIFPSAASTQFRLRIDAPDGTRVAVTEDWSSASSPLSRKRPETRISISAWGMSGHKARPIPSMPSFCGRADPASNHQCRAQAG